MPMITVDSVERAREFYVDKLGFRHMMGMLGKDGLLDFCNVILGTANIMLTRPRDGVDGVAPSKTKRPVEIYMEVSDVDGHFQLVKSNGVEPTSALSNQWWGDRTVTVMDPYGYQIWFYQHVGEPNPPKGAKLV